MSKTFNEQYFNTIEELEANPLPYKETMEKLKQFLNGDYHDEDSIYEIAKELAVKEYRTQWQFDEIVGSLINGNFDQAVNEVIEYGFYAQDLRAYVDNTEWCSGDKYFSNEDLYQVIETATKKRNLTNEEK